jgi:hypothetical protein
MGEVVLDNRCPWTGSSPAPTWASRIRWARNGERLHDWMFDRGRSGRLLRRRDEQA